MQIIGLTNEEQSQIFRMLAAILWLGNVQFDEKDDGNAQVCVLSFYCFKSSLSFIKVSDTSVTDFVAYLLEVDTAQVEKVMTTKVVETQRGGRRGN